VDPAPADPAPVDTTPVDPAPADPAPVDTTPADDGTHVPPGQEKHEDTPPPGQAKHDDGQDDEGQGDDLLIVNSAWTVAS
jgi:hypothetical protein